MSKLTITAEGDDPAALIRAVDVRLPDGLEPQSIDATIHFTGDFSLTASGTTYGDVARKLNAVEYSDTPERITVEQLVDGDVIEAPAEELPETESESEKPTGSNGTKDSRTEPKRVAPNTIEHVTLDYISQYINSELLDGPLRPFNAVPDDGDDLEDFEVCTPMLAEWDGYHANITQPQLGTALIRLCKKGLIEFRRNGSHNRNFSKYYTLNSAGAGELRRLGPPEIDQVTGVSVKGYEDGDEMSRPSRRDDSE